MLYGPRRSSFGAADADAGGDREHRIFALAAIVVGLSLFLPRPLNFAPIGALGLFSGAYAPRRTAWLYPLGALTLYVVAIGGYAWLVLLSVYLGFAVPAAIGALWLRGRARATRIGAAAVGTSVCFFLISNLGSWAVFGIPRGETLLQHYALGLPFYGSTLAGDLVFSAVLFGGYALALRGGKSGARALPAELGPRPKWTRGR